MNKEYNHYKILQSGGEEIIQENRNSKNMQILSKNLTVDSSIKKPKGENKKKSSLFMEKNNENISVTIANKDSSILFNYNNIEFDLEKYDKFLPTANLDDIIEM